MSTFKHRPPFKRPTTESVVRGTLRHLDHAVHPTGLQLQSGLRETLSLERSAMGRIKVFLKVTDVGCFWMFHFVKHLSDKNWTNAKRKTTSPWWNPASLLPRQEEIALGHVFHHPNGLVNTWPEISALFVSRGRVKHSMWNKTTKIGRNSKFQILRCWLSPGLNIMFRIAHQGYYHHNGRTLLWGDQQSLNISAGRGFSTSSIKWMISCCRIISGPSCLGVMPWRRSLQRSSSRRTPRLGSKVSYGRMFTGIGPRFISSYAGIRIYRISWGSRLFWVHVSLANITNNMSRQLFSQTSFMDFSRAFRFSPTTRGKRGCKLSE